MKLVYKFLLYFFFATLILSGPLRLAKAGKPDQVFNIIYILADDMGFGDVGCNNENCKFSTPNIDRLASEGMRFTDAHTSSSVCSPTRYGILTGRYAWRTRLKNGVLQGHSPHLIKPERETIASLLKKQGYQTAVVGKWHLGMDWTSVDSLPVIARSGENVDFCVPVKNGPLDVGFDYYFGLTASQNMPPHAFVENRKVIGKLHYLEDSKDLSAHHLKGKPGWWAEGFRQSDVLPKLTEKAIVWMERQKEKGRQTPFFLYLPLNAPHAPIVPDKRFKGKSGLAPYADYCMEVDWVVGEILNELVKLKVNNNTLVIFTSDNGCSSQANLKLLQSKGHFPGYIYRGLKGSLWDAGHRVPFIVKWPGVVKSGTTTDFLICTTDIMATLADWFHVKLPENAGEDSFSFLPVLKGIHWNDLKRGGIVHHSDAGYFSIRQGKWKLVLHENGGTRRHNPKDKPVINATPLQLFNMEKDPSETTDVGQLYPGIVNHLKILLAEYVKNGRSTSGNPQSFERWKKRDQLEPILPELGNTNPFLDNNSSLTK